VYSPFTYILDNSSPKIRFYSKLLGDARESFLISLGNSLKISGASNEKVIITDTSHMPVTGRGFFSFVREILYLISVNGEKDFHVDYRNTLYNDSPNENMWEYCFEPIVNDPKSKKIYRYLFFTKAHYNQFSDLKPRQHKLFHRVWNDRIRIKKEILEKTDAFWNKNFKGMKTIGVHYRASYDAYRMAYGADGKTPNPHYIKPPIERYFDKIDELLTQGYKKIFLAVDEPKAQKEFEKRYGTKLAVYSTQQNVVAAGIRFMETNNRRLLAEEVMIDGLLLSRCDYLLHGASNIPTVARYINPKIPAVNMDSKKQPLIRRIAFKVLYY
jgi:hypothetical protein